MPAHKLPNKNFDWTPQLAYVVGLIATDGCLSNDKRHIIMRSNDLQLLNTFKVCLGLSNKIGTTNSGGFSKKQSYRVQFGNVQLYNWFLKIGLSPAKTHTIGMLDIPDKFFPDFLRGHLDGDGSVTTYTDYYNTKKNPKYVYERLWVRFISASRSHVEYLRKGISNLLGISGHMSQGKVYRDYQTDGIWTLKFAKKDSVKLLNWMYYNKNVPCLKRKRERAEKFLLAKA